MTPGADDWRNWALVSLLGVIWGSAFTTTAVAAQDVGPLTLAAARLALAAAILTPLALLVGPGLPTTRTAEGRRIWRQAALTAFAANVAPFTLLSWAQSIISSGLAGVLMASLPLIVLPLAHLLVPGERMTVSKLGGFAIGCVGVALLIGWDAVGEIGRGDGLALAAQIACLLAAAGYGLGSIATKLAPPSPPLSFGAATLSIAAAMAAPAAFLVETPFVGWTEPAALATLWLGAVPTAAAMLLLVVVLRRSGPTFLTLVNYQVPIWALVLGVALLGESPPAQAPAALGVIFLGVAISQGALRWLWSRAGVAR